MCPRSLLHRGIFQNRRALLPVEKDDASMWQVQPSYSGSVIRVEIWRIRISTAIARLPRFFPQI
jgi:hypothetical protein